MKLFFWVGLLLPTLVFAKAAPKYGPEGQVRATLLRQDRAYVSATSAPDFWALMPYYQGMRGDHSASAASLVMVLNALRKDQELTAADELVTEVALLKKVKTENWSKQISGKKPPGVMLAQLGKIAESALVAYGLTSFHAEALVISDSTDESYAKVRKILVENEADPSSIVVANYLQSAFTGDPEGAVGTYSPVAAYDVEKDRVLILETDRKYYEPYWVSLRDFLTGIAGIVDPKTRASVGGLLIFSKKK